MWRMIVGWILFSVTVVSLAEEQQSLADIHQAIEQFVYEHTQRYDNDQVELKIGHLDSRLVLSKCQIPLHVYLPSGSQLERSHLLGVSCEDAKPWKIFVPIKLQILQQIPVAARPMGRGEVVQAKDITLEARDIASASRGMIVDEQDIIGKVLTRPLMLGATFNPRMLTVENSIKRGESVAIVAIKGSLKVEMKGIALQDGAVGERISVKNKSSKRVIEAIVKGPGVVEVILA